jgi:hypothetical protein
VPTGLITVAVQYGEIATKGFTIKIEEEISMVGLALKRGEL